MQVFDLLTNDYDDGISNGTTNGNIDIAFRKVNRNSTAFLIWRIENMNVIALSKDQYGTFYDTDSYIVYSANQNGQVSGIDTVAREVKTGNLEYHVHFWLGASTTPEKSGVAAYKTVELDNFLNNRTTQHRETQSNESSRFLSYFKSGYRILKSTVTENNNRLEPKLYRIKGKNIPVLTEMTSLSWDYFNSSEVFIILTPCRIFIWIGRAAGAVEKLHAAKISLDMKDEHKIANIIFVDDGYEKTIRDEDRKIFDKYLPLEKRLVLPTGEDQKQEHANKIGKNIVRLYKCSENSGKYRVAEMKTGPLCQSDLSSEDVYIIDQEVNGIWVWVGKKVSDKERNEALRNARGFVKKKKYSNNTQVTRVVEGQEPYEFRMLFKSWKQDVKPQGKVLKPTMLIAKYDAETMEERPSFAAEMQLIDDGSGTLTVWRIKQNRIIEVPKERHNYFFSGDCYIVLYSYQGISEEKHLLYCWIGTNATKDEISITTTKLTEIDEELGQLGFQARIIQGREPAHFLQIFKGKLTVFKGRGTDFDESGKNLKNPSQFLLHVTGATTYSSKAIQVNLKSSSLNSNYCFVLKRGKKAIVWCGNYSTGDQREMAKGYAGKDFEIIMEGKEKDDFFTLLGGHSKYTTELLKNENDPRPPRLFFCISNGTLKVVEILFFNQHDLIPENVMLLDTNDAIYVWIGKLSSREEQRLGMQTALEYLQSDPSERDINMTVIQIKQGKEPPTFKGFFPSWDDKYWKFHKTFAKVRQEIEVNNANNDNVQNGLAHHDKVEHSDFDQFEKYPINILKEPNEKLPTRIDPLNKELHLTHDDFVSLFKMTYLEFEKLPRWKQQEMKKKVGLF